MVDLPVSEAESAKEMMILASCGASKVRVRPGRISEKCWTTGRNRRQGLMSDMTWAGGGREKTYESGPGYRWRLDLEDA
jgi:hypothetical protein